MLEKFTQEEIEQIKAELGLSDPERFYKSRVIASIEESAFQDVLFPEVIGGIRNSTRNYRTENLLQALTDAIIGNYRMSKIGVHACRVLNPDQKDVYIKAYRDIVSALRKLHAQYRDVREANIEAMILQNSDLAAWSPE